MASFEPPCKKLKSEEANLLDKNVDQDNVVVFERNEMDVGICCYIHNNSGFKAKVKSTWEDFHVHEIDANGQVVHLTTLIPPVPMKEVSASSVLTSQQRAQLIIVSNADYLKEEFQINVDNMSKTERTLLHKCIKEEFPDLCSNTIEKNGSKVICVTKNKPGKKDQTGFRHDKLPGKFCHCVLYKEGKTTAEAISHISRQLHMAPNFFTFSGTKDKRAITTQMLCCSRISAEKLKLASDSLKSIKLGNFSYKSEPLKLGDNQGNRFSIVLRGINLDDKEIITKNIHSIKENGFLNYFGLQRFGTTSLPTHAIGKSLLKGDWSNAIDLLLEPLPDDRQDTKEWKSKFKETEDYNIALKSAHGNDRTLLLGLKRYGKSLDALLLIPRNSIQLYIHAYQSFIWNKVLSKRIQEYGLQPQIGDLVISDSKTKGIDAVSVLKESDLNSFSITDVVLPLPGFDIKYPENCIKDLYTDILKNDYLDESCFKHKVKTFAMPGSYRHIVIKPSEVSIDWIQYSDSQISLILSDFGKLKKDTLLIPDFNLVTKRDGLILYLQLPKSAYATMAIREITHGEAIVINKMAEKN